MYQGFIQDFWLGGGEIYWCINEVRKCEGVGGIFSNSWGGETEPWGGGGGESQVPPPPPPLYETLCTIKKIIKIINFFENSEM